MKNMRKFVSMFILSIFLFMGFVIPTLAWQDYTYYDDFNQDDILYFGDEYNISNDLGSFTLNYKNSDYSDLDSETVQGGETYTVPTPEELNVEVDQYAGQVMTGWIVDWTSDVYHNEANATLIPYYEQLEYEIIQQPTSSNPTVVVNYPEDVLEYTWHDLVEAKGKLNINDFNYDDTDAMIYDAESDSYIVNTNSNYTGPNMNLSGYVYIYENSSLEYSGSSFINLFSLDSDLPVVSQAVSDEGILEFSNVKPGIYYLSIIVQNVGNPSIKLNNIKTYQDTIIEGQNTNTLTVTQQSGHYYYADIDYPNDYLRSNIFSRVAEGSTSGDGTDTLTNPITSKNITIGLIIVMIGGGITLSYLVKRNKKFN